MERGFALTRPILTSPTLHHVTFKNSATRTSVHYNPGPLSTAFSLGKSPFPIQYYYRILGYLSKIVKLSFFIRKIFRKSAWLNNFVFSKTCQTMTRCASNPNCKNENSEI